MDKKGLVIKLEKDGSVLKLGLILDIDDFDFIWYDFIKKLKWYEDEFDQLFGSKTHCFSTGKIKLVNEILDQLSEMINEYRDEVFLFKVVSTLNNIEENHPEFF